jgi:hypothetical protein
MYFIEICTIDGTTIRDGITTGNNDNEEYILTLKKAIQHRPNTRSWNLWTQAITSITSDGKVLQESLGDWTTNHSTSGRWNAYQHNNSVYQSVRHENGDKKWRKYKRRGSLIRQHKMCLKGSELTIVIYCICTQFRINLFYILN